MTTDPQIFANALAGMVATSRRGPAQIAGALPNEAARLGVQAGHEAHRARQEHEAHVRAMQNLNGFNAVVQQQNAQRRKGRIVLPPGFQPIPDDYEITAAARLAVAGQASPAAFIETIRRRAMREDGPEAERRKAESRLKLIELAGSEGVPSAARVKAAVAIMQVAMDGDGETPKSYGVGFHMVQLAMALDKDAFLAAAKSIKQTQPWTEQDQIEVDRKGAEYTRKLQSIPLVRPGLYRIIQTNNNIQPMHYVFGLFPDGSAKGRIEGVDHVMGRNVFGLFNPIAGAQAAANAIMRNVVMDGSWAYELSQDAKGRVHKRVLQLSMHATTTLPFGGQTTQDMLLDLGITARNGSVLLAQAEDGSQWRVQEEVPPPPPRAVPQAAPAAGDKRAQGWVGRLLRGGKG